MDDSTSIRRASEYEEGILQDHCVTVDQLCTTEASEAGKMEPPNDEEHMKDKETEEVKATKQASQPTPESLFEVKIHNDTSERLNEVTFKWFSNLYSGFSIHEATKDKPSFSNVISTELYTLKFDKASSQIGEVDKILAHLEGKWCDLVSANDCRHLWLEIKRRTLLAEALSSQKHELHVVSMSLGSFPSTGKYCRHWNSDIQCNDLEITVCIEYDLEIATIQYEDKRRGKWRLETAFDHLDKFILLTTTQTGYHVYLFQKNPHKIFFATKSRPFIPSSPSDVIDSEKPTETEFLWERRIQFGDCPTEIIGSSNVIQLQLGKDESKLNDVLSKLTKLDFSIIAGSPMLEDTRVHEPIAWPEFKNFRLTYAWYCLMSRGFKVTDQVTQEFVTTLNRTQHEPWFEETLRAVTSAIDNASICNLEKQFQNDTEAIMSRKVSDELETENESPVPHVVAIRRLILTPTTIKGLGEEWTVENRVLREFGSDRFVRVSIRDDDFTRLTAYIPIQEIKKRIIDFLTNGFKIGDRHYRFLGCSNSQLRSHSVWMYASDGQEPTVDSIRTWMGDISHERCVATYVSRLGQCFTSARNTVEVKNVEWIEDITRNATYCFTDGITRSTKYCFTDGIGRISAPLARRVAKALNLRYTPSAFQIRFGGCKGVVALAPDLGEEEKLQLRKSMEKFSSEHNQLEIVEMTRPVRLCLNRQAMLLLSGLGVPDEAFFKLQDRMLVNMADILFDENIAIKAIAKVHLGIEWKQLKESGIVVTTEPLLREILATIYRQRFNDLLTRTHIEIPEDKGRIMIGTVDEFDCLEYGEVFVQFSKDIDNSTQDKEVLNGSIVITKSPCFHPGDMRKLKAVDKVELHHMVDCIVFPAKGPTPHPNEMSGSDLDGDMYFVCWEESLIPPLDNMQAMDFTPQKKHILSKMVTEADMIQFIGQYIDSDQLGVIASAHLVHADSKGVNYYKCIQIANTHSNAVDFPKTGRVQTLPQNLRPALYPDYMMKTDKPSYISNSVIGKLFQQCRTIEVSNEFRKLYPIVPDPDLILPGHETYLDGAKVMKATYVKKMDELKAMYGIETDVELLSVGILGMQKRLGHLKRDHYAVAEIIKLRLEAIKEQIKNMFYKEFGGARRLYDSTLLFRKASALYRVSYTVLGQSQETKDQNQSTKNLVCVQQSEDNAKIRETKVAEQSEMQPDRQCLGLAWIFWDLLCMIKKQKSSLLMREIEEIKFIPKSFLHKISLEIASVKIKYSDEASKGSRVELLRKMSGFKACNEDGIKLIPFGSVITNCANNASSLDVFVDIGCLHQLVNTSEEKSERFKKIAAILTDQVGGELNKSTRSKPVNKLRILEVPYTTMKLTLFSDSNCLWRTAYIVAAMVLNKWAVPVLRIVLAWGRNTGISSSSGDSLLSEEELVITFFHFTLTKYGNSLSEDILYRSRNLLMDNHFQTCHLDECTHIEMSESVTSERMLTRGPFERWVKSDPVDTFQNLSASKPEEETRCGQAALAFFHFYGLSRGSALKDVPHTGRVNYRQRLLNLKDLEYIQLGEQMMQAYHSLANCSTVDDFLHPSCQEDRRFAMFLPNEVSSIFKYVETSWEETLTQETGVSFVNIRKKMFRGWKSGHVIEAWGNAETIRSLKVRIHRIIGSAPNFVLTNRWRNRWSISGAYRMVFEGATGPESKVEICRYNGRCQRWHNEREKQVPMVIYGDPSDAYSAGEVISHFENQRLFLRKNYRINVHGRIRVAVSFGNFYMFGFEVDEMKVGELSRKLSEAPSGEKAKHMSHDGVAANCRPMPDFGVNSRPGVRENIEPRRNTEPYWDDMGLRNRSNFNRPKSIGSTFNPSQNLDLERLKDFLKWHNFVETENRCEYRPTIKMKDSDGIISLNENLELTMFHLQEIRWCVLTVSRGRSDLNPQPTDIRITIHSRPIITAEELAKRIGCEDLLENAHRLLHRNSAGEVDGIALDEYKNRINYMRYKNMTSFRFRGKTGIRTDDDQDNFLNRITFKLNRGKEYRKKPRHPNDGMFTEITDQMELILETELPDLEDKEECDEFMREIYEFSKDFASRFVDFNNKFT